MGLNAFESLFVHAPTPLIVVSGPELRIEHANRAAHELAGSECIAGKSLLEAFPELEEQGRAQWLREGLRRPRRDAGEALIHRTMPTGQSTYWALLCWRNDDGPQQSGVVVFVEKTAQMFAQHELEQRAAQAAAANAAKDRFVAMLSHELRNTIAPVVHAVERMRLRGMDTREQAVIERQMEQLNRLVDDLLEMARIARGRFALEKQSLNVETVVAESVEMVEPLLHDRRLRVRVDVPKSLRVTADPHRMRQVLSNLLINAVKYSAQCSEIVVSAAPHERKVLLSVLDHGIGMTPERLARLFDPEAGLVEAGPQSGLGLGLVIARALVRQHGGDLHAYSEGVGAGSRFVVELPSVDHDERGGGLVPGSECAGPRLPALQAADAGIARTTLHAAGELIAASVAS